MPCTTNLKGTRSTFLALVALLLCSCTQQMAHQPRYGPLEASNFFLTVRRRGRCPWCYLAGLPGQRRLARYGNGRRKPAVRFPMIVDSVLMQRGQQRYNIYCSPCHDYVGTGNGMAAIRGFQRKPPSFHSAELLAAPVGHFFDVITNGFGAMPSYANQIPVSDRWAIIAYIRALQLSQAATIGDVPPDERRRLESEKEK